MLLTTNMPFIAIYATTEPDFARDIWEVIDPTSVKGMICVPVFDSSGRAIAVIQAINKIGKGIASNEGQPDESEGGGKSSGYRGGAYDTHCDSRDLTMNGGLPRHAGFTERDVQVLKVLASHVSVSLQSMYEEEAELTLRDTMKVLKEHGLAGLMDDAMGSGWAKPRKLFPADGAPST